MKMQDKEYGITRERKSCESKVGTREQQWGGNCMLKHELLPKDQRWIDDVIQFPASKCMD